MKVVSLPKALYHYFIRGDSLYHKGKAEKFNDELKCFEEIRKLISVSRNLDNDNSRVAKAFKARWNTLISCLILSSDRYDPQRWLMLKKYKAKLLRDKNRSVSVYTFYRIRYKVSSFLVRLGLFRVNRFLIDLKENGLNVARSISHLVKPPPRR